MYPRALVSVSLSFATIDSDSFSIVPEAALCAELADFPLGHDLNRQARLFLELVQSEPVHILDSNETQIVCGGDHS